MFLGTKILTESAYNKQLPSGLVSSGVKRFKNAGGLPVPKALS